MDIEFAAHAESKFFICIFLLTETVHFSARTFSAEPLQKIIHSALSLQWTGDPFDRIIVTTAKHKNASLITQDKMIKDHYNKVIW